MCLCSYGIVTCQTLKHILRVLHGNNLIWGLSAFPIHYRWCKQEQAGKALITFQTYDDGEYYIKDWIISWNFAWKLFCMLQKSKDTTPKGLLGFPLLWVKKAQQQLSRRWGWRLVAFLQREKGASSWYIYAWCAWGMLRSCSWAKPLKLPRRKKRRAEKRPGGKANEGHNKAVVIIQLDMR